MRNVGLKLSKTGSEVLAFECKLNLPDSILGLGNFSTFFDQAGILTEYFLKKV